MIPRVRELLSSRVAARRRAPNEGSDAVNADSNNGSAAEGRPDTKLPVSEISARVRIAAILLRALFIGALILLIGRLSIPQSETIWSAYETPGDLVRLALGFVICVWLLIHVFMLPKDPEGYRTWIYLGLAIVPFALIVVIAVW